MSNQSVRAVNNGSTDFKAGYDGITYTIKASSELIVPWDAAALWFGDPRLWNSESDKARTKEYERLRARWGVMDDGTVLADTLPDISIFLLSDGTEVQMLGVDPSAAPVNVFDGGAEEDMGTKQRVSHLEQQLAAAIERLNSLTGGGDVSLNSQPAADSPATIDQPVVDTSDDLATDGDTNPPVPGGAPSSTPSSAEALKAEIAARRNK